MAGAALVFSLAMSSQAQVYSQNVVGYVNRVIPAYPGYALIANPFDTGNNVLSNLLQTLPVGSKVIKWDYVSKSFDLVYTRNAIGSGWVPAGSQTVKLNPGDAAFVLLATTNTTPFTNTFVGTVLQGNLAGTNTMIPGYSLLSFPVPVAGPVTNSIIALNASLPALPTGSKLMEFDEVGQSGFTEIFTRNGIGSGWGPSVPNITPATGFFILDNGSTNNAWNINFTAQ